MQKFPHRFDPSDHSLFGKIVPNFSKVAVQQYELATLVAKKYNLPSTMTVTEIFAECRKRGLIS